MTNLDLLRRLPAEQMAYFLAEQRWQCLKPVFEYIGVGITKEACYCMFLKWLREEVTDECT